jgi:hypothetical protein
MKATMDVAVTNAEAITDAVPAASDDRPLLAINWSGMVISAKLVTNATPGGILAERFSVFPQLDDRLPHRRALKPLKMKNKLRIQQNLRTGAVTATAMMAAAQMQQAKTKNVVVRKMPGAAAVAQVKRPAPGAAAANGGENLKHCHICGRGFSKSTYLKRHIQSHSSVKPYKCEICGWGKKRLKAARSRLDA